MNILVAPPITSTGRRADQQQSGNKNESTRVTAAWETLRTGARGVLNMSVILRRPRQGDGEFEAHSDYMAKTERKEGQEEEEKMEWVVGGGETHS